MKKTYVICLFLCLAIFLIPSLSSAQKPIVLGAPLPVAFLYGWTAEKGLRLAVEEINAAGGVTVGREKRPFKTGGDGYPGP